MSSYCILMSLCIICKFQTVHWLKNYLTKLATSRLSNAFSNSTKRAYAALFSTFLAFAVVMSWELPQVKDLLCFLACFHYNGVKHFQTANYLSAIKSKFVIFGQDVVSFTDHRLKYYQSAVQLHVPLQFKLIMKSLVLSLSRKL